ncbi:NAD(P)H dehydrogenase (quinone) [Antricoccus suffuscus]|uniref:NAD(P)H dehydrogenase (Quinone) n=1 Tax=Antricoccus suffuscus TaxID=1629062 RepID=A0A2T0ZXE6_9ACTN|nr:NAD(P)H:quinone oxidoreductase [Antricoccus suffuscus]PRZ41029.1 NAD(P)H dehydrogenase (quinone) [Antricoccus suffuscus]
MTEEDSFQTTYLGGAERGRRDDLTTSVTPTRPPRKTVTPKGFDADDNPLRVAVIYYSATGIVHQLAQSVAQGARDAGGSVRVVRVRETVSRDIIGANPLWDAHVRETASVPIATTDDVQYADVVLLGTPTRFGNVSSQLQAFIDTWGQMWGDGAIEDKVFAAFTSSATHHGGQEGTIQAIYRMVCHLGGIVVPPGYTEPSQFITGNPYGASHTSNNGQIPPDADALQSAWVTGNRATRVARALRLGTEILNR